MWWVMRTGLEIQSTWCKYAERSYAAPRRRGGRWIVPAEHGAPLWERLARVGDPSTVDETVNSIIPAQAIDVPHEMTTTGFELPGFRIHTSLGVVRETDRRMPCKSASLG